MTPKTTVTVTMGKPSELAFKLSKRQIPVGAVIFKVVNSGKISHTFKICSSPKGGDANACKGTVTKSLAPGATATLTVTLKKGTYEYLCTLPGHAAAGMKGVIGVGVKPPAPAPAPTPTTTSTPTPTPTPTPAAKCTSPQTTTVTVGEFEYGFKLSATSIPCGTVTFAQTNTGGITHNFDLLNIPGGNGALIDPGASTTNTVTLLPGTYPYQCDVFDHASEGMQGTLTVTGS